MRRTLPLVTAAAVGAALLSCAPRTPPQAADLGPPVAQPQPAVPAAAPPAAPARAQRRGSADGAGGGALPPGDTLPGWSAPRGGIAQGGGPPTAPGSPGLAPDAMFYGNTRGGATLSGAPNYAPGASSSSMTGGEPARVGGAPPADTSRAPGSSGIGGAGIGNSLVGGPNR